jgi:flagellar hook-associated protein 3 FlgL
MRIAYSTFPDNFIQQVNQLQVNQQRLQNEASTGLKLSLPEDDPAAMGQVLNLQTQSEANTQYQTNISQLQTQATTTSNALSSLQTIINQVGALATSADGTSTPQELASDATQVNQLLGQALQIGNTKDANGNYIFGGTNTGQPPFVATTDASGNITAVSYQGGTTVLSSEISQGVTVSAQALGANTAGSGPTGVFTDSRTGADLFSHLISLRDDLTSGNTTAISSTDSPAISKDESNLIDQVASNGSIQSRLQATGSLLTQQGLAVTSEISNQTDANLSQVLTEFSQAQTAYQAALQSGVSVLGLSLLNFLP